MVLSAFVMNHGGDTFAIYECDLRETRVLPSRKIPEMVDFAFRKMKGNHHPFWGMLLAITEVRNHLKVVFFVFYFISSQRAMMFLPKNRQFWSWNLGSSAKKAAGGSLDICPRSAVLQSMTSNKKRGTLVTFPETPGISLQQPHLSSPSSPP